MLQNERERPSCKTMLQRGGSRKLLVAFPSSLVEGRVVGPMIPQRLDYIPNLGTYEYYLI